MGKVGWVLSLLGLAALLINAPWIFQQAYAWYYRAKVTGLPPFVPEQRNTERPFRSIMEETTPALLFAQAAPVLGARLPAWGHTLRKTPFR
jgi:hypothetical protein